MVSSWLTAAQSSSESGMTKTTLGMSTTSSADHVEHQDANPQHHQDHQDDEEDYDKEGEGKDSYTVTTIPGRCGGSKTVWSEATHATKTSAASPRDADAADVSAHSLSSGRSLSSARSSRSRNGGGGGGSAGGAGGSKSGGRAASMLARARLTATTSAGSCSMRSVPTSQQAKAASASGSGGITARTGRARSFDQHEEEEDDDDDNNGENILPTSSGEYYEEYSTSLNDVSDGHGNGNGRGGRLMDNVKLDGAQDNNDSSSGADQSNSSLNEVDKARMELWGVAARNANNNAGTATATRSEELVQIPQKQPHQAGQGTSESRDREQQQQQQHQQQQVDSSRFYVSPPPSEMSDMSSQQQQQQQRPQEYTPQINQLAVLFSQAQSLGQKAYDRGQQSYRNLQSLRQGYGYDGANGGRQQREDDYNDDDGDDEEAGPTTNQPEITSGFHGQSHESFFSGAAAANASSYLSDMCSLLIVLVQAPFLWLYFVVTGRDYHDRYGLQQTSEGIYGGVDATTSQNTFASRTSKMSAEEKQERSEVYLEAKDEDGALFAMVSFSHGL